MNIWLVNPYGPIPSEGWRDYRYTIIGKTLAKEGHRVTWWTSNYSHHFKRYRSDGWCQVPVDDRFSIELVPSSSYTKNISLDRILFELSFSINFYKKTKESDSPDLIITIDPPQFVAYSVSRYSQKSNTPYILDVMDEWPELFVRSTKGWTKLMAYLISKPLNLIRRNNFSGCAATIALAENYNNIALKYAKNKPNALIYNGVDSESISEYLKADSNTKKTRSTKCIYAGSLGEGDNYDIHTILRAIEYFNKTDSKVEFIIAGAGELTHVVEKTFHENSNLTFYGSLNPSDLYRLYKFCDIGLCAYGKGSNVDMPDKFYDYTAGGLAIINSLKGEVSKHIVENRLGLNYSAGDSFSMIDAIELIAENNYKMNQMKKNSLKIASRFDNSVQYKKLPSLIDELCI